MNTMMTYIKKEQITNQNILQNRDTNLKPFIERIKTKEYKKWIILATGSSANASECAKYYIESVAKIPVEIQMPFVFSNYTNCIEEDALYIAVTQSGHSYSTIEAVKKASILTKEAPLTLTANLNSTIAKENTQLLNIGCGEETVGFVTMGFSATVLSLMLMGLEYAKVKNKLTQQEYINHINKLQKAIDKIDSTIEISLKWYEENKQELIKGKRFVTIGYGAGYGVAKESETKITETIRCPMNAHELEEYMHGPYLGLKEDDYIFFLATGGKLDKRLNDLKQYVSDYTSHTYMISCKSEIQNKYDLNLNQEIDEFISPLLMIVPIQVMSYHLAEDKGNNLSVKIFTDFDDKLKSKI